MEIQKGTKIFPEGIFFVKLHTSIYSKGSIKISVLSIYPEKSKVL